MATVQRPIDSAEQRLPAYGLDGAAGDVLLSKGQAEQLVVEVVGQHSAALLRTARKHSLNVDDAQDAYQRGLEIFLMHARRLHPGQAHSWLHTVIKHEAMQVRTLRQRDLASTETDFDAHVSDRAADPADMVVGRDRISRSAVALRGLKPQEVQALWLKASGLSYDEIGERQGWTRTKVNRCVTEGRRAFLDRYAGIESGQECADWLPRLGALLDDELTPGEAVGLREHLRVCRGCQTTLKALHDSAADLRVLLPVPLLVGAGHAAEQHDHAIGLVLRVYEAVVGGAHERAVASITRWQALAEGASAAKVAAVAASAVVVAGGGTAVVERARENASQPAGVKREQVATPAVRASAPVSVATLTRSATRAATRAAATQQAAARAQAARRVRVQRAAKRRAAKQRAVTSEFGFAGAAPTPSTSSPRGSARQPAPTQPSAGAARSGSSQTRTGSATFGP